MNAQDSQSFYPVNVTNDKISVPVPPTDVFYLIFVTEILRAPLEQIVLRIKMLDIFTKQSPKVNISA